MMRTPIQKFYDTLADEFRAQDEFWANAYDTEIWRLEHELLRPKLTPGSLLLDVGCGFYPHFEFTRTVHVIAGDFSFRSLIIARNFGDESSLVRLCQFDAMALPFRSQSFGALIVGGELLNHLDDYPAALSEFARVIQPGGWLLLQVGARWCFDSIWALIDTALDHPFEYALTRLEAAVFLKQPAQDVTVTWDITTSGSLRVKLLAIRRLRRAVRAAGFRISQTYGANSISGVIPLPVQQESESRLIHGVVSALIRLDRIFGRLPPFRTFAGNVFLLCRRVQE